MNLLKTSFLSAIETGVKLASGFVVIKYIAMQIGPEGVAYFGQFQNFLAAFIILITGSATTGLVCFSAQEKEKKQTPMYLGSTIGLGVISCCILGVILCVFSKQLSFVIFKTINYSFLFYFLSIVGIFIVFFQAITAQLNGLGEIVKLLTCKATSSIVLLLSSLFLVYWYGLPGGLVSLVCMQAISAFVGIWLLKKTKDFQWRWLVPTFDRSRCKNLMVYWLTSFVTLISTPLILILVRINIVDHLGWQAAGVWESSWKIAELYLLVITTGLTIYYVPNLSKAKTVQDELIIIKTVLIWGVSSAVIFASGVYFFRFFIVSILFSKEFLDATVLLKFQLLGSVIKIASWILAYHMLVKRKIMLFLISELFFGGSFYLIAKLCLQQFGLVGLSFASFITYCFYLVFCLGYIFRIYHAEVMKTKIDIMQTGNTIIYP